MTGKSGGGAATSSGVNYQNRVAAYLLGTALCDISLPAFQNHRVDSIGFETTEAVDDINVALESGRTAYLQVKRKLSYSTDGDSEMYSVLKQFAKQFTNNPEKPSQLFLVTTSDSSKTIVGQMKAVLDAFRHGPEEAFRRDQPKTAKTLLDGLLNVLSNIIGGNAETSLASATAILRSAYIWLLDLHEGSCLEQATILLLNSKMYLNPSVFWGKLISDCVNHSSLRHSIFMSEARDNYEKFRVRTDSPTPEQEEQVLKVDLSQFAFSVGKELVLGTIPESSPDQVFLFEFYRFDDKCNERIRFDNGKCLLSNGLEIQVLHRTATVTGMERFLKERPEVIGNRELTIAPFNSDTDLEKGICADLQRAFVKGALLKNDNLLRCLHCGKAVSSSAADIVESGVKPDIRVGLTHRSCTYVDDRVLGQPNGNFFTKFDYLVNFDVNLWFKAAQCGQGVFAHRTLYEGSGVIAWSGRRSDVPPGDFIVECRLVNGLSEFMHERGQIHRFTKAEADLAAAMLNANLEPAKKVADPFCFSDQTKAFGRRSVLLKLLGVSEQLLEIREALVTQFRQEIANAYSIWGNWYAPLAYLRALGDGLTLTLGRYLPVLTNPFKLDRYLENWKLSGIEVPEHEVMILQNDRQFDDFASDADESGVELVVDPLVDPTSAENLIAGIPIQSMRQLLQRTQHKVGE